MTKALLVVDMQSICVGKNSVPFFQYDKEKLLANVNSAIAGNSSNLVVYVKNIMPDNFLNRHFAPFKAFDNTQYCRYWHEPTARQKAAEVF